MNNLIKCGERIYYELPKVAYDRLLSIESITFFHSLIVYNEYYKERSTVDKFEPVNVSDYTIINKGDDKFLSQLMTILVSNSNDNIFAQNYSTIIGKPMYTEYSNIYLVRGGKKYKYQFKDFKTYFIDGGEIDEKQ